MDLLSRLAALVSGVGARTRTDGGAQADERGTVAVTAEQLHAGILLDGVETPVFVLDADGRVIVWNDPITVLMGVPAVEALGSEHVSELFYPDSRRAKTLADKVLDDPRSANVVNGLDVANEASRLYRDTSTMTNRHGAERHIAFTARPLFESDELIGVVEAVHNRTDVVKKQRASEALVEEVSTTVGSLIAGGFSARASFADDRGVLEGETPAVVSDLNEMATRFNRLANEVGATIADLGGAIQRAATATTDIESQVTEQVDLLSTGAEEVQGLSTSIEEIAATPDEVASTANQARMVAENGHEADQSTRSAASQVIDTSDELLDSVTELQQRMVVIEEIVEVIAEVVDRTSLLTPNANIETARADEAGEGFSVVVDEVKQLANQTHEHTEEIADSITEVQEQVDETALASEQSHEQIQVASGEIEDVPASLSEIADAAGSATNDITEVARATDSQTTNIEEITNTVQMAQEHVAAAETSTIDITDATTDQTVALDALADRVDALVGGNATAIEELDVTDFGGAAGSADADADADSVRVATDGGSDDEFDGFQSDR